MNMFLKTQWRELDTQLCPLIKKELNLSRDACTEYLYGDSAEGLFGIPVSADDSDVAKVDTAFKLLTSSDPFVAENAWNELRSVTEKRQTAPATFEDMGKYLDDAKLEFEANDYKSV